MPEPGNDWGSTAAHPRTHEESHITSYPPKKEVLRAFKPLHLNLMSPLPKLFSRLSSLSDLAPEPYPQEHGSVRFVLDSQTVFT